MGTKARSAHHALGLGLTLAVMVSGPSPAASWPQWGGPHRNFAVPGPDLAPWSEHGPHLEWAVRLGPGYSALVSSPDGRRLLTMTRRGGEELIVAIDAHTGEIFWEHHYDAPLPTTQQLDTSYGDAPAATPSVASSRVYALGFTGFCRP